MLEMLLTRTLHGCLSTETGSWEGSNRETHPTLSFYPWAEWKWLTEAEALAECWFQFPCVWGGSFHSTEQSSATAARFPTTQLWHLEMMSDPTGAGLRPTRLPPFTCQPQVQVFPMLWANLLQIQGSHDPLLRFDKLARGLTEFRKTFYGGPLNDAGGWF